MGILVRVVVVLALGCSKSPWDGKSPLVCANNETLSLKDCKADLPGKTVIRAENNCTLKLTRCTISGDIALAAENNTKVTLVDTVLAGQVVAVRASNNVTIDVE